MEFFILTRESKILHLLRNALIIIMGDFNIDLLKCETTSYSYDFLSSLQSCFLIPSIDTPTRVRSSSATLIDNIFVNTPYKIAAVMSQKSLVVYEAT